MSPAEGAQQTRIPSSTPSFPLSCSTCATWTSVTRSRAPLGDPGPAPPLRTTNLIAYFCQTRQQSLLCQIRSRARVPGIRARRVSRELSHLGGHGTAVEHLNRGGPRRGLRQPPAYLQLGNGKCERSHLYKKLVPRYTGYGVRTSTPVGVSPETKRLPQALIATVAGAVASRPVFAER